MGTYHWWPILYTYLPLMTNSAHREFSTAYFIQTPPQVDWNPPSTTFHDVLWFLCLFCLFSSIYIEKRTSGDLFCTHTSTWWPILYKELFIGSFCTHTTQVDLFSISTTCSWPSLYTCDFYGLLFSFTFPWWAYVYLRDIVQTKILPSVWSILLWIGGTYMVFTPTR